MNTLHNFGLIRFSKKTGKIDTTMISLGKGMIQMWALQNTTKTKVSVILDIDDRKVITEYIGTSEGFPDIQKNPDHFEYTLPDELWDIFAEEVAKRRNDDEP